MTRKKKTCREIQTGKSGDNCDGAGGTWACADRLIERLMEDGGG